jgi:tRNA (mo5U34)-methyltransferase
MAHIRVGDAQAASRLSEFAGELAGQRWYHSFQLPDGRVIEGWQSLAHLRARLERFPIPDDLRGKRVLDIGCWDGWFSFEMERRGAEVVAADIVERDTFLTVREALGSKVQFVLSDVYQLTPDRVGRFDIVLFFGVLYHLKHPLLALERVCALTTDLALVESFVTDDGSLPAAPPVMEFYETSELLGRFDNWCGPNTSCLLAFCRTAGFATIELRAVADHRAHVVCGRRWPAPPPAPQYAPRYAPPIITGVVNQRNGEPVFDSRVDEYMSVFFKSAQPDLTRADVLPEMDGFGVFPASVARSGASGWQVDCRIGPGSGQASRTVRLRTSGSTFSKPATFEVDAPQDRATGAEFFGPLEIRGVADSNTWEDNVVWLARETFVSVWVRGLPDEATRGRVRVRIGNADAQVLFVSALDEQQLRQINVRLPAEIGPGNYPVVVVYGTFATDPRPLRVSPVPEK